ncbi:PKD domain-containing protein [Algoriphagus boritolerans]|uniref:SprB repeat-containing protein n=1 Tax=Algoriphagus boritolerans DSM 17298 = JCM 18970 TaxID=1120964 RepID=A0A1H5RW49_9BACT|nr:PKD domain-containing protein [Algoriphagus boritolerans]SEF42344.1 SprB repeat-containing protein [Algoriphagus boritolerans DSM 17298 = JCM 18970]
MGVKVYKKIGVLIALLLSIWGISFALNPALTWKLAEAPFPLKDFFSSSLDEKVLVNIPQSRDTLIQSENARVFNTDDIVIPIREGFPFCETFIGFDLRDNIVLGGNAAADLELTGNSLQLTGISNDESGYMFVDIPFSSLFGLKVSFEFSNFGGTGADGVSFFMFDGSISASDFQIGGTGGALGYTSVRATLNEATLISPGLRGAYLGIGFDELGNFGNSRTGKFGGFEDPNNDDALSNTPLFPHSVVVRGPVDGPPPLAPGTPFRDWDRINDSKNVSGSLTPPRYQSYKFIDGRIFDPASTGIAGTFPPVSVAPYLHPEKFEIDTDSFSDSCPDEGFRKVFLDLNPVDVNDPTQGYTIEIQMLINVGGVIKLVNVFDGPINYPFAAPELLKVGFAASTGLQTNYHQIRNVTVQVSNQNALEKPIVEPLRKEVCEGEVNTFDLEVELRNDAANAFIRCMQLYYSEKDALNVLAASGTSIPFPPAANVNSLCSTGNCIDLLCRPERASITAYDKVTGEVAGEFQVLLVDEGGVEVPRVRFAPQPGYSGETTIYYTATDNFGQVSDPESITIIINPQPDPVITTLDPLDWEQQEGTDVQVLLESSVTDPANDYQWIRDGVEIPGANGTTYLATQAGEYAVEVTTPLNCVGISQESVTISIVENLDPDFENSPLPETCADLGIIEVKLNNLAVIGIASDGTTGNEKWRIVDSEGNIIIDWTFLAAGQNEILQGDLVAGDYIFQLGDEFRSGQPGSDGKPLYRHQLPFTILPIQSPLQIAGIGVSPELCFGEGGTVEFTASGGEGSASYTFSLTNTSTGQVLNPTSVNGSTAVFEDVMQGDYNAVVSSATRCTASEPLTITGPASPIALNFVNSEGISCGIADSGFITWEASGGTPPYSLVNLTRDGMTVSSPVLTQNPNQQFAFTNLTVGQYILTVSDANGCEISSAPVDLTELPAPVYEVNDLIICEGETASVQPQIIELSNSQPVFTWTTPLGDVLTGNTTLAGVTYTFQDDGDPQTPLLLQITGLNPGTYNFTLSITGTNICTQPDQIVEITVSPDPVVAQVDKTNLTCFQSGDGVLEVILDPGLDPADYTYELLGYTGAQDSNLFENLQAGMYQIRVVDKFSNCDTVITDLEITEPPILEIVDLVQNNPSCNLENGSFSFSVQGGTPDYSLEINNTPIADFDLTKTGENYLIENLLPGNYTVQVTDSKSCVVNLPQPVALVNDQLDPITVAPLDTQVCEGNTATITPAVTTPGTFQIRWFKDPAASVELVSGQTDADGISYQIVSGTGALSISGLQLGQVYQYFMEISGPQLCTLVEMAQVEVVEPISAVVDVSPITCFGDTDGTLTILPSGGNGNYEVSINGSPFVTNLFYDNLAPGDYTVDIRNDIFCEYSTSVAIESPANPIAINEPTIERSSCGQDNGAIRDLIITGGWGEYQVEWRKGSLTGTLVTGTISEALNLAPDTYYLIVKDKEGCVVSFDFIIEESSDPVYDLVPPINSCTSDQVIIRPIHLAPDPSLPPAAATEVRWYTGPGQTGLIQNGADPTLPAVVYTIDDSDWLNPELVIEGLPAGNHDFYFYVVCTGQELKVDVGVFETPSVQIETDPVLCFGDSNGKIRITNDLPEYTFSLNSAAPTTKSAIEALNLPAGNYTLVVNTPAGSCPQTVSFAIDGPQAALTTTPLTKIDPGCGAPNGKLELTVTGGWLPHTLEIFKDGASQGTQTATQSNIVLNGYRPGEYYIIITDAEGCTLTTNTVNLVDGPTQVLVDKVEICLGETVVLSPELAPVAPGAVFEWFFDAAKTQPIISNPAPAPDGVIYQINPTTGQLTISQLPATDFNFYVTASGPGVCPGFTGIGAVEVHEIPTATTQIDNEVCYGDGGTITVIASGGSGNYTYSLNGAAFVNSNSFQVPIGIHTIEVLTAEGCSFVLDNISVTGPSEALLVENIEQDNPSCDTDNGQVRFEIRGGYEPYSITVIQNGNVTRNLTLPSAGPMSIPNLGEGTYTFEITDDQGCVYQVPGTLDLKEVPSLITAPNDVICEGETSVLTPSLPQNISNPNYTWSFDAAGNNQITSGVVNNVTFSLAPNGELSIEGLPPSNTPYTYYIMASGPGICGISPMPVQVIVHALPNLRVSNPSIVCDPAGTVDLSDYIEGFNPSVYDYNVVSPNGSALRLDEIDHVNLSGDYRVSSSLKGTSCWNPAQRIRVLIAEEELIANFEYEFDLGDGVLVPNTIVQIQEDVLFKDLSVGNVMIWNWDFGDGNSSGEQNPVHQFQEKGTYTVTLTAIDSIGCISTYQIVITVNADYNIMIPNAFTPDGFKNQYFKPYYRGIASMEFYIFNTWGELIYKAESLEDLGWDGYHNGRPAINGNYVFRGVFMTRGGDRVEKSGVFILIR